MLLPQDLVAKLNECASTNFVGSRDWWFNLASRFTLVVIFGIGLEAPELVHDLIPICQKIKKRFTKFPEYFPQHTTPHWVKVVSLVGWLLVVSGIAGELITGIKVKNLDASIQECSDAKVREVTIDAGDAATAAARANSSARQAHEESEKAKAVAGTAESLATGARKQIQGIEKKEADFKKQADETAAVLDRQDKLTSDLIKSLSPRVLGFVINGNVSSFDDLKPFAGTKVIFEVLTDAEARRAAQEIENTLRFAGWDVLGTTSNPELYTGFNDGVRIEYALPMFTPGISVDERSQKAAEALELYLLQKDWEAHATGVPNIPNTDKIPANTVKIVVGFKPDPFFEPDWVKQMRDFEKRFMEWERNPHGPPPREPTIQPPK